MTQRPIFVPAKKKLNRAVSTAVFRAATVSEDIRYAGTLRHSGDKKINMQQSPAKRPSDAGTSSIVDPFKSQQAIGSLDISSQRILEQTKEQSFAAGRQAGIEEGIEKGVSMGQQQAVQQLEARYKDTLQTLSSQEQQLTELLSSMSEASQRLELAAQQSALDLCFAALSRILLLSALDPQMVRAQIEQALQQVQTSSGQSIEVHVHPAVWQRLEQLSSGGTSTSMFKSTKAFVTLKPDANVSHGGCIVMGPGGGIDARLEMLLNGLVREFSGATHAH
jgi:flagellar assembly protein FliH